MIGINKRSIKFRLATRISLLIAGICLLISLVFDLSITEYMKRSASASLTMSREFIASDNRRPVRSEPPAFSKTIIINRNYEVVFPGTPFGLIREDEETLDFISGLKKNTEFADSGEIKQIRTQTRFFYYTGIKEQKKSDEMIIFFVNMTNLYLFKRNLSNILWVISFGALIAALVITYFISSKITNPVKDLSAFAKSIGEGKYIQMNEEFQDLELHELKEAMNDTVRKLDLFEEQQKIFFQNVSHELRTPLQIIKTCSEGLEVGILEKEKAVLVIKDEIDKLGELVEDIIYLSRLESRSSDMIFAENDLRETFSYTVQRYSTIFDKKNIRITYDFPKEAVYFTYDEKSMERALGNLISNALRYTNDKIIAGIRQEQGRIIIYVEDNGEGIPKEDIPKIFERFYKGNKGMHGIGLAIVDSVVKSFNGRTEVDSQPGKTIFTILLPS